MNAKLEIDVNKIIDNIELIRKDKEVCLPVKGNCYGLGLELIEIFIEKGYSFFAVSTIDEAKYIRSLNQDVQILIFSAIFKEDLEEVRKNNLIFTVYDFDILEEVKATDNFHLKIDTGMGRLGFQKEELDKLLNIIVTKKLKPMGIYTHLPEADNEMSSQNKIKEFEKIVKKFNDNNIRFEYVHLYNGVGALKYNTTFDNLVRPGLAIYGYYGSKNLKEKLNYPLKEAVTLKARISHTKNYSGEIGYDGIDNINGRILTIPIGYHDGIRRTYEHYNFTNIGKIVGKVCMCQFMIQTDNNNLKKGDYIQLFGNENSIYRLSEYSNISVYEILSCLSNRITRVYKNNI